MGLREVGQVRVQIAPDVSPSIWYELTLYAHDDGPGYRLQQVITYAPVASGGGQATAIQTGETRSVDIPGPAAGPLARLLLLEDATRSDKPRGG
jgi:hypothetical protein